MPITVSSQSVYQPSWAYNRLRYDNSARNLWDKETFNLNTISIMYSLQCSYSDIKLNTWLGFTECTYQDNSNNQADCMYHVHIVVHCTYTEPAPPFLWIPFCALNSSTMCWHLSLSCLTSVLTKWWQIDKSIASLTHSAYPPRWSLNRVALRVLLRKTGSILTSSCDRVSLSNIALL